MDVNVEINKILELKCIVCDKLLSVPPIYFSLTLGTVCGRCIPNISSDDGYIRQTLFECIAEDIIFPCCFNSNGCRAQLHWGEVKEHEDSCKFKPIICPLAVNYRTQLNERCKWKGSNFQLNEHILSAHKEEIIYPPKFVLSDLKENVYFTKVGSEIVTILIKPTKTKYLCLVMLNGSDIDSKCYRYQMELFDNNQENSIIFRKSRLYPIKYIYESWALIEESCFELDSNRIQEMLKKPDSITVKFSIVKKNKKEIEQITGKKMEKSKTVIMPTLDENMLLELECPVCNEHMVPPIYMCQTGHSFCETCKSKVTICPICRSPFQTTRNYTLEKLTTKVNYPCRNKEAGCPFVSPASDIRQHELLCDLTEIECLLSCGWKGIIADMETHINRKHDKDLIKHGENQIYDLQNRVTTSNYVILYQKSFFRFSVKHSCGNGPIIFKLQQLGVVKNNSKCRFQFKLVYETSSKRHLCYTDIPSPLIDVPSEELTKGVHIGYDLLKHFIFEGRYFNYKVSIFEHSE